MEDNQQSGFGIHSWLFRSFTLHSLALCSFALLLFALSLFCSSLFCSSLHGSFALCSFVFWLFALSLFWKELREWIALVALFLKSDTIHFIKRANCSFSQKKQVIHMKKQRANSQPCQQWGRRTVFEQSLFLLQSFYSRMVLCQE